jgi:hypothetical protein
MSAELMNDLLRDRPSTRMTTPTPTLDTSLDLDLTLDVEEDEEEENTMPVATRSLRKRNAAQTNPYKFDKIKHEMTKSTGKAAKDDQALQHKIDGTEQRLTAKRTRDTGGRSTKKAKRSSSNKPDTRSRLSSETSYTIFSTEPDISRTTLQVWLDQFPAGAATVSLEACDSIDKLMDFITESWEWQYCGGEFHYAIASFPWLDHELNILLRPNSAESFKGIIRAVENAPMWSRNGDKATCNVKIMVYLQ